MNKQVVEIFAEGMHQRWCEGTCELRWNECREAQIDLQEIESGLAALRAEGFDVYRVEDRQGWRFCPVCGRHNRPEDGGISGVVYCSPTNCSAWKIRATFDHETREWVPVGGDS